MSTQYKILQNPIVKSPNDDREYRHITLENGLEAILCSDVKTDKAAACLTVDVGHLSDPDETPGLAHFCEHLLFMGTERFPSENEYKTYLKQHAGHSNASTDFGRTTYYFDVSPSAIEGAIERFSQFFVAPLFAASCVDREVQAVNSEFLAKYQMDNRRVYALQKSTANPKHPYCKFPTGNLDTLQLPDIRERLLEWYPKNYSANRMHLAVVSAQPLDEITKLVVREFSGVVNRNLEPNWFGGRALETEQLQKVIYNRSIKDIREVLIQFPVPDIQDQYETKPQLYLSHFLNHEGPGSLHDFLKQVGWADYVAASGGVSARGFDIFSIYLGLTEKGLEKHADVLNAVFDYLKFLLAHPPSEEVFNELKQISDTSFRFLEKSQPASYVQHLVGRLQSLSPREEVLRSGKCFGRWYPEQVVEFGKYLNKGNCRVIISSKVEPEGVKYDQMEKRYQIEYTTVELEGVLSKATEPLIKGTFALPPPNKYIPRELTLKGTIESPDKSTSPSLLVDNDTLKLWHKLDDQWGIPRGHIRVRIRNPEIDRDLKKSSLTSMACSLFEDACERQFYDAKIAGHSYGLDSYNDYLTLRVSGYNEKLPTLVLQLLKDFQKFTPSPERFPIVKDWYERACKNFALKRPDTLASRMLDHLLSEVDSLPDQALEVIKGLTLEEVCAHIPTLLDGVKLDIMLHGNFTAKEAKDLSKSITKVLSTNSLIECKPHRQYLLPARGCNLVYQLPGLDAANANSAIDFSIEICLTTDFLNRAKLQLMSQILSEPVFDQLRTKEQLGYIVHGWSSVKTGVMKYTITIQSEKNAGYLEERIEAFLDMMKGRLEEMSGEDLEKHKRSKIDSLLEKDKNMREEVSTHWSRIQEGYCDFEKLERDAKLIPEITKEEVIAFFNRYFHPSTLNRRKISVHILSQTVHDSDDISSTLKNIIPASELDQVEKLIKTKPPISKVEESVVSLFEKYSVTLEQQKAFVELIKKLKASPALSQGATLLERDEEKVKEWQRGLEMGPIPARLLKEDIVQLEAKL